MVAYLPGPTPWSCWWLAIVFGFTRIGRGAPKKQHYHTKVAELVTKRIVSQIEAQHCGLESLYPVFKDASIKRFVEQNRANSLCFVRNFFLGGGGEGSIAVG